MNSYRFVDAEKTLTETPLGVVPWGEEGPLGGGEAWRRWEEDGKPIPLPYIVPLPTIPTTVSPRQARRALLNLNMLDMVEAKVATLSKEQQIDWEYAIEIKRDNPVLIAAAQEAGVTEQQLDQLFILAATYE